jgi:hypothetical protein
MKLKSFLSYMYIGWAVCIHLVLCSMKHNKVNIFFVMYLFMELFCDFENLPSPIDITCLNLVQAHTKASWKSEVCVRFIFKVLVKNTFSLLPVLSQEN